MSMFRLYEQCRVLLMLCLASALLAPAWAENALRAPVKIGLLLPLSGNYSVIGSDSRQGFEIALEEFGGTSKIELHYADSKADPSTSITEIRKLIEQDKTSAVFTFRSPVGMAVNPISQQEKIPLLGGVGYKQFPEFNQYAFQLWPASDQEGKFLAEQVLKLGNKRIALFTSQDEWTDSVSDGFRAAYKAGKGQIVSDLDVVPAETDFRSMLTQLRGKALDALVLNVSLAQIAPLVRQSKEQGFSKPLFSNFWCAKKEVIEALGEQGSEGLMFVEISTDLPQLNKKISERYGTSTSGATLSGYIAAAFLLQAINSESNALINSEILYQRLLEQSKVSTNNGTFEIHNRRLIFPMALKSLRSGKAVVIPNS